MKIDSILTAEGKPLPKSYAKTLAKLVTANKIGAEYADTKNTRTNPYSGATVEIPALAAALADWIVSVNPFDGKTLKRSDWDNARYTFMACWPKAYYDLID